MFCSKCGARSEGRFCPSCGAPSTVANEPNFYRGYPPQHVPTQRVRVDLFKIFIIVLMVICSLFAGLCVLFWLLTPSDKSMSASLSSSSVVSQSIETEPEAIKVTAESLLAAYGENEVNADNKYKGQLLEVSGIVGSIGKDIFDEPYVTLGTGEQYEFVSVQCYFKDAFELEEVADLKPGDSVTIVGICSGSSLNVILKNCKLG